MKTPTKKEQMQMLGGMKMHLGYIERQLRGYEIVVSELRQRFTKETEQELQNLAGDIKDKLFNLWSKRRLMEE